MTIERRYDIDWLRVIAIALLLIYHISIVFQPWGVFIVFLQNADNLKSLWIPMSILNVWRIPLLFFVSGMGVAFAIKKRNWQELMLERAKRILLPFVFGVFAIVPLHIFIFQIYYSQEIKYTFNPGHLWFLGNIFVYVLLLSPIFFLLKRNSKGSFIIFLNKTYSNPFSLFLINILFIIEVLLVKPETFEFYAMNRHGFFLGLLAFFLGFTFVFSGQNFWQTVLKYRWFYLISATALFLIRYFVFELKAPTYFTAIESNIWIFSIFGFGYKNLNKGGYILRYLSEGAYPIYIIHMIFMYLSSYFILPLQFSAEMKFIIIIVLTTTACTLFYEFFIRRISFLRIFFGLKPK